VDVCCIWQWVFGSNSVNSLSISVQSAAWKDSVSEMICCTSSEISELRALLTRHSWTWTTVVSGMVKGDRSLRRLMRRWSDDISDCVAVQCWRLSNWHWTGWHAIMAHRHHWVLTNDSRTHYLLFGLPTHSALLQNYGAAYVAVFLVSRQSLLIATAFSLGMQLSYAVCCECDSSSSC